MFFSLFKYLTTSDKVLTGIISSSFIIEASLAFSNGNTILFIPIFKASIQIGRIPINFI